jgi:hypothetical protein
MPPKTAPCGSSSSATSISHFGVWARHDGDLARQGGTDTSLNEIDDQFALGDVDGDGLPDLVTIHVGMPTLFRGDGAFGFTRAAAGAQLELTRANSAVLGIDLYDGDADGDLDLVSTHDNYSSGIDERSKSSHMSSLADSSSLPEVAPSGHGTVPGQQWPPPSTTQ